MTTQNPAIDLFPVRKGGAFDHWEMSVGGGPRQGAPFPQLSVKHGNNAEFSITISDAQGIEFQPYNLPSSTPIYIQAGLQKPTGGIDADIKNIKVKDDPQTGAKNAVLKFHDGNQKAGPLTYVLNFKGADPLDPIVNNGGGGPGLAADNLSYLWYAAGAVALLAVVAIILAMRRAGPRVQPPAEGENNF